MLNEEFWEKSHPSYTETSTRLVGSCIATHHKILNDALKLKTICQSNLHRPNVSWQQTVECEIGLLNKCNDAIKLWSDLSNLCLAVGSY